MTVIMVNITKSEIERDRERQKMKRINKGKFLLAIVLILFVFLKVTHIQNQTLDHLRKSVQEVILEKQEIEVKKENRSTCLSNALPEDCKLCGNKESTQISWYESQDNLGIISINTFEISYIEINRYNDCGCLIEETDTSLGTQIRSTGENGFVSAVTVNMNRGYASGNIHMNQDKILNMEEVSVNLCMECREHLLDMTWGEPYGVGLIYFKTGEVRLFEENVRGFMLGDFYVLCEPRAEGDSEKISKIDLHIFYCPERSNI